MLGETFEFQDDKRKFVAEKISQRPPIMACHAEGEGWEYWATNEAKNRLNGEHRTFEGRTEAAYQDLRQILRGSSDRVDAPEGRCRPLSMVGFVSLISRAPLFIILLGTNPRPLCATLSQERTNTLSMSDQ